MRDLSSLGAIPETLGTGHQNTTLASSTQDLRSTTQESKRFRDHKAKWSAGGRPAPGHHCSHENTIYPSCADCSARPITPSYSKNYTNCKYRLYKAELRHHDRTMETDLQFQLHELDGLLLDFARPAICPCGYCSYFCDPETFSNSEGEVCELDEGTHVLHDAVAQAVEHFENREMEKLVRSEYDWVSDSEDDMVSAVMDEESDFELVEVDSV